MWTRVLTSTPRNSKGCSKEQPLSRQHAVGGYLTTCCPQIFVPASEYPVPVGILPTGTDRDRRLSAPAPFPLPVLRPFGHRRFQGATVVTGGPVSAQSRLFDRRLSRFNRIERRNPLPGDHFEPFDMRLFFIVRDLGPIPPAGDLSRKPLRRGRTLMLRLVRSDCRIHRALPEPVHN